MRRAVRPPKSRLPVFGRALAGATLALGLIAAPAGAAIAPDVAHSPGAEDIRTAYWVMLVVASVIGVALLAGLLTAARRFRARGGHAEPRRLTAGRGAIGRVGAGLGALALVIFIFGVIMTGGARDVTADESSEALEIDAIAQQWLWRFEYPAESGGAASPGIATTFSYTELVVPVDTPVNLSIDSTDVLHSWFIPALGPQVLAVPGEVTETSFIADEEGYYEGKSTQFSGTSFPAVRSNVRVVSREEYDAYVTALGEDLAAGQSAVQQQVGANAAEGTEPVGESDAAAAGGATE